ncbi:hypothetical protein MMC28_000439 [Mycoblastus sanguinarius]|nr:hypothetical protein [Mycoblastus sanguinarius]
MHLSSISYTATFQTILGQSILHVLRPFRSLSDAAILSIVLSIVSYCILSFGAVSIRYHLDPAKCRPWSTLIPLDIIRHQHSALDDPNDEHGEHQYRHSYNGPEHNAARVFGVIVADSKLCNNVLNETYVGAVWVVQA